MAALTKDRNTAFAGESQRMPDAKAKGNVKIYNGALTCFDANGYAVPAADTANYKFAGVSKELCDSTATNTYNGGTGAALADGTIYASLEAGVALVDTTSDGNALTLADMGKLAYIVDDHTMARVGGVSNNVIGGIVVGIDASGQIMVETRRHTV